MNKYFKQYKWSNIFRMLKNQKKDPKICDDDFKNHLVVITGATSGIGYETAKKYASMGASILSINRNEEKSVKLCETLKKEYGVDCSYILTDFSRLEDIKQVSMKLAMLDRDIDVLIHNAGTYLTKKSFTEDHIETIFQINYLSTFIMNYILIEKFKNQNKGRIVFVNSEAHRFAVWGLRLNDLDWNKRKYRGIKSYGHAKMAQLLSMIKFDEYFHETNVTINAMHPGNIKTNSGNSNGKFYKFFKKKIIDKSARPINIASEALYYLGVSNDLEKTSGKFFNLTTLEDPAPPALDKEEAEKLWAISLKLGELDEK